MKVVDIGVLPLSVDGDHSINNPLLKAVGGDKAVGMFHIDGHCDTGGSIQHSAGKAPSFSNKSWFKRARGAAQKCGRPSFDPSVVPSFIGVLTIGPARRFQNSRG